ncbi:MAG: PCRF domain-containing protein [Candidatus Moeniiplasma glomeromycotorum]|nr:PCRF domain-containing protein [Candidatus Moeniiplasma glomeromycotorum]MCE8167123.1 PCRF domain-containing protein [Candidatus Moeniiplasma glomeromycotorum]MCE8168865.1 PCRF domain-containing protein [Candidatus Moeniiplasma glomeromycotorum]
MSSSELTTKIIHYLENNNQKGNWSWFLSEYQKINQIRQEYRSLISEINKNEQKFLLAEIKELTEQEEQLVSQIKEQIIAEKRNEQEVIMEIRPGTGGVEAGLFARDLYRMYYGFAKKKGWKVEIIESRVGREGNFVSIFFTIKGKNVFSLLKNEAGVHRVQRDPQTEKEEKVHTSTASVAILPPLQDVEIDISPKNLRIETYGSSGPGGQHANKTESAVKVTYTHSIGGKTETITAVSQESRKQHENKKNALLILKKRLWEKKQAEQNQAIGNLRSTSIGRAERFEKIRTYNFIQNRVTDHRLKISWEEKLEFIIEGNMEEIIQKLIDYEVEKKIV